MGIEPTNRCEIIIPPDDRESESHFNGANFADLDCDDSVEKTDVDGEFFGERTQEVDMRQIIADHAAELEELELEVEAIRQYVGDELRKDDTIVSRDSEIPVSS